ncbi:MAG: aminoacyl-tRNA hydrolase [Spirosomaceae bacterium]|nr:aminoacyl-tRNA hydrolase [Spirosomataceae bacterium]
MSEEKTIVLNGSELPNLTPEFRFQTSRSGGAGGQHVNKVETKVEVRFDIPNSKLISEEIKAKLLARLKSKLTSEGVIILTSQASRSQLKNKELAVKKLIKLLRKSLKEEKKRKATKPSKAAIQERLKDKKSHAEKKALRGKPIF